MPHSLPPKKIVYLFGAGATHAEIRNLKGDQDHTRRSKTDLLLPDVSRRVFKKARRSKWFKDNEGILASSKDSSNIELYISLLESNRVSGKEVDRLKLLVQKDIEKIISPAAATQCYLYRALLELHKLTHKREYLLGLITLNYDTLLDDAFQEIYGKEPNYCLQSVRKELRPLLKLHGSFNWREISVYGRKQDIPIMPLGVNKNYLAPPYNFVWGRAFELLVSCDTLRIIGCSLSQNDLGLLDLLYKAHYQRQKSFSIEIIDFQPPQGHHQIKKNYGFFPDIVDPKQIEGNLISDKAISDIVFGNPFKIWLSAKAHKMLEPRMNNTTHLIKLL